MTAGTTITVPYPQLQIEFAAALAEIRAKYLQDALNATVRALSVPDIDRELALHAPRTVSRHLPGMAYAANWYFLCP